MSRPIRHCPDRDQLRRLVIEGSSLKSLSARYGAAPKIVRRWLAEIGLQPARVMPKRDPHNCSMGAAWQALNTPEKIAAASTPSALANFWAKVQLGPGCWEWTAGVSAIRGYGNFCFAGFNMAAHRVSWMLHNGVIPANLHVLHRCHNRRCVNPAHLYVGDNKRNHADVAERGNRKGERNHQSKLSDEIVREIRVSDLSTIELGKKYGVHPSVIGRARNGQRWSHVK